MSTAMDQFSKQMLRFGTIQGFGYFQCYLRGREELLVTIQREPQTDKFEGSGILTPPTSRVNSTDPLQPPSSESIANPPAQPGSMKEFVRGRRGSFAEHLRLATQAAANQPSVDFSGGVSPSPFGETPKGTSVPNTAAHWGGGAGAPGVAAGAGGGQSGVTPASPAATEACATGRGECLFLIGSYQRYKTPYVWLRGGSLEGYENIERDVPLLLKTTNEWHTHRASVWDIVSELVSLAVKPKPRNPLAVNFTHLEDMALMHSTFCSAAIMSILSQVLRERPHKHDWLTLIDLQKLAGMHFLCFAAIAEDAVAPQASPLQSPHTLPRSHHSASPTSNRPSPPPSWGAGVSPTSAAASRARGKPPGPLPTLSIAGVESYGSSGVGSYASSIPPRSDPRHSGSTSNGPGSGWDAARDSGGYGAPSSVQSAGVHSGVSSVGSGASVGGQYGAPYGSLPLTSQQVLQQAAYQHTGMPPQ